MTPDEYAAARTSSPIGKCRGCGADIYWITTKKGKHVPCDPALVQVYEGGREVLFREDGSTLVGTTDRNSGGKLLGSGRRSHWGSCPNAQDFRGGKRR